MEWYKQNYWDSHSFGIIMFVIPRCQIKKIINGNHYIDANMYIYILNAGKINYYSRAVNYSAQELILINLTQTSSILLNLQI